MACSLKIQEMPSAFDSLSFPHTTRFIPCYPGRVGDCRCVSGADLAARGEQRSVYTSIAYATRDVCGETRLVSFALRGNIDKPAHSGGGKSQRLKDFIVGSTRRPRKSSSASYPWFLPLPLSFFLPCCPSFVKCEAPQFGDVAIAYHLYLTTSILAIATI